MKEQHKSELHEFGNKVNSTQGRIINKRKNHFRNED